MPFKLDDENYYFETVECMKGNGLKEHTQDYLALCPVCSAKFQHANGSSSSDIKQAILEAETLTVPVLLARQTHTIRFVGDHLKDLVSVLGTATEINGEDANAKGQSA